jgi:hypothetical protein
LNLLIGNKFDIQEYLQIQSSITLQSALNSPQISSLNKENEKSLSAAIRIALGIVNKMFNLPDTKKLNDMQINYLVSYLKKEYWRFKFDEFIYIFGQGIAGKFGKSYNRLDVEVVSEWFKVYERDYFWQQRELSGLNEAANLKRQEREKPIEYKPMPEHIKQEFAELARKLNDAPVKEEVKTESLQERLKQQKEKTDAQLKELLPSLTLPELKEMLNEFVLKENESQAEIIREYISNILNELKW